MHMHDFECLVHLVVKKTCTENKKMTDSSTKRHEKGIDIEINQLCDIVRETSFAIHKYHRNGHLEKIYENALVNRLRQQGLKVEQQHPLTVYDEDGSVLGESFADLYIEDGLIVELKACKTVADEHISQLLGYLKSSRIHDGLLINFGAPKLYIKKFVMD